MNKHYYIYYSESTNHGGHDDEGIECRMKDGYFAIWMQDICSYYGVEMNNVFDGDGW